MHAKIKKLQAILRIVKETNNNDQTTNNQDKQKLTEKQERVDHGPSFGLSLPKKNTQQKHKKRKKKQN